MDLTPGPSTGLVSPAVRTWAGLMVIVLSVWPSPSALAAATARAATSRAIIVMTVRFLMAPRFGDRHGSRTAPRCRVLTPARAAGAPAAPTARAQSARGDALRRRQHLAQLDDGLEVQAEPVVVTGADDAVGVDDDHRAARADDRPVRAVELGRRAVDVGEQRHVEAVLG